MTTYTVELQWLEHIWEHEYTLDMGSSSYWGLIVAPDQDAKGNNLGMYFSIYFLKQKGCWKYSLSLESPRYGDPNECI